MKQQLFFMQCQNPACRFRFPLDLNQYQGKICPKCGHALLRDLPQTPQWQPEWLNSPLPEIHLLLDNIRSGHNVGSIFRSSEGAGVSMLHLCGLTPAPDKSSEISKTALGADRSLSWQWYPNSLDLANKLKAEGFNIVALEATPEAIDLFSWQPVLNPESRLLLILGGEPTGVDPALMELADQVVFIPMAGIKSSLNVSVACGIALYSLLSKAAANSRG